MSPITLSYQTGPPGETGVAPGSKTSSSKLSRDNRFMANRRSPPPNKPALEPTPGRTERCPGIFGRAGLLDHVRIEKTCSLVHSLERSAYASYQSTCAVQTFRERPSQARTIGRCTPCFFATPEIVPPISYSLLICS